MKSNYCNYVDKGIRLKIFNTKEDFYVYIKPCCHMTHELIPEDISKPVKVDSFTDILNLKPLQYFRNYFEKNENLHPACVACSNDEAKGIESPRNKINNKDFTNYDINKLDVVLGNSCNLACPFCTSYASSLIDKLSNKLNSDQRPESWFPLKNDSSSGSKKTGEIISQILQNYKVHTLKLIGGEPFLKENWEKIADVIDNDYCKDLNLEVTTNGTFLNETIFNRLSKTKSANILISVDSIGKNYEFIRWPHKWSSMHKNLQYLRNNKIDNINLYVTNLVNIFNFEFLPEIEEYFCDIKHLVGYSTEIKPYTHLMNYQNLPQHIIDNVKSKIKSQELKNSLTKGNNNYTKDRIKKEFEVLLRQRNMNANDVIGPLTREYFEL